MAFLDDYELRRLELGDARAFRPIGVALGMGAQAVEVAVVDADRKPSLSELRALWKARHRGRARPLLVAVLYDERAAICGPTGDQPPAYMDLEPDLVERICRAALEEPDRHAALRRLHSVIPNVHAPLAGLRNEGLFATHELEHDVRRRADWPEASSCATPVLRQRGEALLRALGFSVEPLTAGPGSLLRAAGTRTALAIFLDRNESPESPSRRFSDHSPITWALKVADQEQLRYAIVCNGAQLRLYLTELGRDVGQRARAETYVEIDLDFIQAAEAGYLWLLFSAPALSAGGSVEEILEQSRRFAVELGERLRERVYQDAIPRLAKGLLAARGFTHPNPSSSPKPTRWRCCFFSGCSWSPTRKIAIFSPIASTACTKRVRSSTRRPNSPSSLAEAKASPASSMARLSTGATRFGKRSISFSMRSIRATANGACLSTTAACFSATRRSRRSVMSWRRLSSAIAISVPFFSICLSIKRARDGARLIFAALACASSEPSTRVC
jgi:hypothetical protein